MATPDRCVLVLGPAAYHRPFRRWGPASHDPGLLQTPDRLALVVFTGGEDLSTFHLFVISCRSRVSDVSR